MSYELTKAEEQVMQVLWEIKEGFVKDVLEKFPEPKPAYNTVSTIIRILEKKKLVGFKAFGRTHLYFPLIAQDDYLNQSTDSMIQKYFGGSAEKMLSFFVKEKNVSAEDLEKILNELKK